MNSQLPIDTGHRVWYSGDTWQSNSAGLFFRRLTHAVTNSIRLTDKQVPRYRVRYRSRTALPRVCVSLADLMTRDLFAFKEQ